MTSIPLPFYDNPLLFGHAGTRGLLAFRPSESHVTVYARGADGVAVTEEPFRPFLLLADPDLASVRMRQVLAVHGLAN